MAAKRKAAGGWILLDDDGAEVGRIGGREGHRWGQLADGVMVTEDSPVSAKAVEGLVRHAATQPRVRCAGCSQPTPNGFTYSAFGQRAEYCDPCFQRVEDGGTFEGAGL